MCRMLCVRADEGFEMEAHLAALARIAHDSKEYQGHGWGCAWIGADGPPTWCFHHDISPIWEDAHRPVGRATLLVAHARSAFRDEGIRVENNMPFHDDERVFAFNGELRGVRIRERGRIGAEKVFNFVKRFDRGDFAAALKRGLDAIERRTRYARAMNVLVADTSRRVHFASRFREDPEYFQMHMADVEGARVICSEPYPDAAGRFCWTPVENGSAGIL